MHVVSGDALKPGMLIRRQGRTDGAERYIVAEAHGACHYIFWIVKNDWMRDLRYKSPPRAVDPKSQWEVVGWSNEVAK